MEPGEDDPRPGARLDEGPQWNPSSLKGQNTQIGGIYMYVHVYLHICRYVHICPRNVWLILHIGDPFCGVLLRRALLFGVNIETPAGEFVVGSVLWAPICFFLRFFMGIQGFVIRGPYSALYDCKYFAIHRWIVYKWVAYILLPSDFYELSIPGSGMGA